MAKPKMLGRNKPYTPNSKMDKKHKTFIKKGKKK